MSRAARSGNCTRVQSPSLELLIGQGWSAVLYTTGVRKGSIGKWPGSYVIGQIGLPVRPSWIIMPMMPIIAARPLFRSACDARDHFREF